VTASLDEAEYLSLARAELKSLLAALDQLGDELEAELSSDILTIEHGRGAPFVINSHTAARQIWMAAERRAWHFDYDRETQRWIATKSGDELWQTLTQVLSAKIGRPIRLAGSL
jgi:CyaY protein